MSESRWFGRSGSDTELVQCPAIGESGELYVCIQSTWAAFDRPDSTISDCLGSLALNLYAGESSAGGAEVGELKLDGAFVERLTLTSEDGRRHKVDVSAETLTLPPGTYRPCEVTLQGGYQCWPHQVEKAGWVIVCSGQKATLKVGAPLEHRIRVKRQEPLLIAEYELAGQGGETYAGARRSAQDVSRRAGDRSRHCVCRGALI